MVVTDHGPSLGEGIYTFGEAARLLRSPTDAVSARQLRYWMQTGLTPATYALDDGTPILTFHDLISLEIVRRFKAHNVSVQTVRKLEVKLREHYPGLHRPFAYRVFYTDGESIWAEVVDTDADLAVIELVGERPEHVVWREAIETFAQNIRFEGEPPRAAAWTLSP